MISHRSPALVSSSKADMEKARDGERPGGDVLDIGGEKAGSKDERDGEKVEGDGFRLEKGGRCKRSARGEGSEPPVDEQQKKRQKMDDDGRVPNSTTEIVGTSLLAAFSEDKGSRTTMEDVAIIDLNAKPDPSSKTRVSFFGVFDGHGGLNSARFASEKLHKAVLNAGLLPPEVACGEKALNFKEGVKCVVEGFQGLDSELLKESEQKDWQDGCAAVGIWVVGEKVIVGNVGDAKCVLGRISNKESDEGELKALVLTKEHLAIYPKERARIEKRGGFVSNTGRLDGRLQVSRSLGDVSLKKKGLTAVPDVQCFTITERDRLMICGCDGFWKVFDPQDAVKVASKLLAEKGPDLKSVTNRMINMAVRERRCTDNCTVMLVRFSDPPCKE